jgi:hypothetical protein
MGLFGFGKDDAEVLNRDVAVTRSALERAR